MTGLDFSPATGGQGEGLRGIRADHGRGARTAPDANTRLLCDAKSLAFCGLASEGRRTDGPLPLAGARVPRAACRRCAAMLCSDSSLAVMGMQPAGFRLSAVPDPRTSPWQHRAGNLGSSRPGTSAQEARAASCPRHPRGYYSATVCGLPCAIDRTPQWGAGTTPVGLVPECPRRMGSFSVYFSHWLSDLRIL